MGSIDYKKLYSLQDEVLDVVFATEQVFYLTGGTALSRFYQEKRYSDDLDFFTHDSRDFRRGLREIKTELKKKFHVKEEVSSKDFVRLMVNDLLQVDFVNDSVIRYGDLNYLGNGYIIDNCKNILANKITAVMGRDNPKDIFDIFLIDKYYRYDWKAILDIAHKKAGFDDDDLIIRLKTFPSALLKNIHLIDSSFLNNFEEEFNLIVTKIEESL